MKPERGRTNEEIVNSLLCNVTEASRILNLRYAEVVELLETGKIHSFEVGKRKKVSVESMKAFARGDGQEAPTA